jgi:hypothetical protein
LEPNITVSDEKRETDKQQWNKRGRKRGKFRVLSGTVVQSELGGSS